MSEGYDVGVIGAGYVGLTTGACFSHLGHRVTCVDKDARLVAQLEKGRMPFYEPGLAELVEGGARQGRLRFSSELESVVPEADVVFIAVDTPRGAGDSADLSSVAAVARRIGRILSKTRREHPLVVVNKSTVPVGSGDYVSMLIRDGLEEVAAEEGVAERQRKVFASITSSEEASFLVASNPEFLREGSAIYDSLFPDRVVVGANSREAIDTLRAIYEPVLEQSFSTELDPRPKVAVPFISTDLVSAEMIKYAANAFLATKVSFINEVSNLCELVGADVSEVAAGIGLDQRIGTRFLSAGIGWGGSCFPKDVAALRAVAREYDYEPLLLEATVAVNERQRKRVISKLQRELHTLKGKRVALLGLAFKPNTDDLRGAPSLEIARTLNSLAARVVAYDPVAGKKATAEQMPEMKIVFDPYEALEGAHAAVLVTEWEEFRSLDLRRAAALMEEPRVLVDGRNAFEPDSAYEAGLTYRSFGRGTRKPGVLDAGVTERIAPSGVGGHA
jgi:UDPglucose 6-dehydrogenase